MYSSSNINLNNWPNSKLAWAHHYFMDKIIYGIYLDLGKF